MSAEDNVSTAQFKIRPNLNNKPNSQGTLFTPTPEAMAPDKRYPRGYTPQRMRAVRETLGQEAPRSSEMHGPVVVDPRKQAKRQALFGNTVMGMSLSGPVPQRPPSTDLVRGVEALPRGHTHPFLNPAGDAQIHDAIARSTIPTEHLHHIGRIRVGYTPRQRKADKHASMYHSKTSLRGEPLSLITMETNSKNYTAIRGSSSQHERENAAYALTHEIGHAASHQSGQRSRTQNEEEAKADAYALQHYRPDPRSKVDPKVGFRQDARKGVGWVYSEKPGDSYDPDLVRATGESQEQAHTRRIVRPAANYRTDAPPPRVRPANEVDHEGFTRGMLYSGSAGSWRRDDADGGLEAF